MSVKPPPGHVLLIDIIGQRAVTPALAAANRARLTWPIRPRKRVPGLLPLDAAGVAAAVAAGALAAPVRGPWGLAWPLDAIDRWRRHQK